MNDRDSEVIYGLFAERGWAQAPSPEEADCVLFNTCSVRAHSEQRAYSNMGALARLKRRRPHMVLGFIGCTAQKDKDKVFKRLPHVDLATGPAYIYDICDCVEEILKKRSGLSPEKGRLGKGAKGGKKLLAADRIERPDKVNPAYRLKDSRGYISISEGCDNFCSYCIVPYVRGRQRSRRRGHILDEVGKALQSGISSITLLGQNVNSYGTDLEGDYGFLSLLRDIHAVEGIKMIRFVTCHPKDTNAGLFELMKELPKIHRHLHMPLQSGSDEVLKKMKRGYTVKEYLNLVKALRNILPGSNLTTDIIVGFPGESDRDFRATYDIMKDIAFDSAYIFKYSPRPPAESGRMDDDVPEEEKKRRNRILLELQKGISAKNRGLNQKPLRMA